MTSADEARIEARDAEHVGLKTCAVSLGQMRGKEDPVMLLVSVDGKAIYDLGDLLKRKQKGSRVKSALQCIWKLVVVVSDKPWAQKMVEEAFLGWMRGRVRRGCSANEA